MRGRTIGLRSSALVVLAMVVTGIGWGSGLRDAMAQDELDVQVFLPLGLLGFTGDYAVATAEPATATPSPTDLPSATPTLTETPAPTATPTKSLPLWQARVDFHRALANLPGVEENEEWSRGSQLHARYMVKTDHAGHDERTNSEWYTPEGLEAARLGNVYVYSRTDSDARAAVDGWMTAPFHQIAILDPELQVSGYGEYVEAIGQWQFGATLSVLRGRPGLAEGVSFPVRYPEDGQTLPFLSFDGNEFPDPLTSCPGYTAPTGPPLVLMLGAGEQVPNVRGVTLLEDSVNQLQACYFDETRYANSNAGLRDLGRAILGERDAIIVLPKSPLKAGSEYQITIVNGSDTHTWSFRAAGR